MSVASIALVKLFVFVLAFLLVFVLAFLLVFVVVLVFVLMLSEAVLVIVISAAVIVIDIERQPAFRQVPQGTTGNSPPIYRWVNADANSMPPSPVRDERPSSNDSSVGPAA